MHKLPWYVVALLLASTIVMAAPKPPKADKVLAEAKARATEQHKAVFLIFGASWCPECHSLDSFLAEPEMQSIFDKYFVIARLSAFEEAGGHPDRDNPGSDQLMQKFGGFSPSGEGGFPYIVILDASGSPLINSNRPVQGNPSGEGIGFPTQPEEINWFLTMLQKGAASMTPEETLAVKLRLRKKA